MTGQAAGVAGALAANANVSPRLIKPNLIQRELLKQGAYLSPSVTMAAGMTDVAAELDPQAITPAKTLDQIRSRAGQR
jgi:hypothetical protein